MQTQAQEPAKTVSTGLVLRALVRAPYDHATDLMSYDWIELCTTPGSVALAAGQEQCLRPLDEKGFGDAELAQLAVDFAGTNLMGLDLTSTRVTDAGLPQLAKFGSLVMLSLDPTGVTDAGLPHLAGLTNLTVLDLGGCQGVTDAGLVHLARLTNLGELNLRGCRGVTDAGLPYLAGLTNLTALNLGFPQQNGLTDAGVAALQQEMPNCGISKSR